MRRFLAFLLLLTCAQSHATETPTVLVFGDSLSTGYGIDVDQSWATLLQVRLANQGYEHQVINASISGDTTESGAARIAQAIASFTPSLVILELGANDGLRGIPLDRMRENLQKIITTSQNSGATVVLLGIRLPPNYGQRYIEDFDNVFRELASELDIPWIEFFMEGIALHDELLQSDGMHPNAAGQPILLDNAWPMIDAALVNLRVN